MRNLLLSLVFVIIGLALGGIAGAAGLFFVLYLVELMIEDKTTLGWIWFLYLLVVPVAALLGSIVSVSYSKKWMQN